MVGDVAKVFRSGRSQAVRIPRAYRFDTAEVSITRRGDSLILTPRRAMTWNRFFGEYACPDFAIDRGEAQAGQERNLFP